MGRVLSGSLLYRVQDLLRRKPNSYDLAFCVGPAKDEVKAVKILLAAASPVLEKKFAILEIAAAQKKSMPTILLPDVDPDAFRVFVKLAMLDTWTVDAVNNSELLPDKILKLSSICSRFEVENALKHSEDWLESFYKGFAAFKDTPDFLTLTQSDLRRILSSDNLQINEVEIFEAACRWAKAECAKQEMEGNAENLRFVLGDCLFEIRFPLMTTITFATCLNQHSILTPIETVEVFKFLSFNDPHKSQLDFSQLPFKTKSRAKLVELKVGKEAKPGMDALSLAENSPGIDKPPSVCSGQQNEMLSHLDIFQFPSKTISKLIPVRSEVESEVKPVKPEFSTLSLAMDSQMFNKRPFICDGKENNVFFKTKRNILVHGLGFTGPIDEDAYYDVNIQIKGVLVSSLFSFKRITKRISAQKSSIFRVLFDQPVHFTEGPMEGRTNYYNILFSLEGPNTKSLQRKFGSTWSKHDGENEFRLVWWSYQLAEVLYTNV